MDISAFEMIKRSDVVVTVGEYNKLLAAVTDHLRMPYFITSPVPVEQPLSSYHIRMVPDIHTYTLAIRDLFQHYHWKDVGVLYNTAYGKCLKSVITRSKEYNQSLKIERGMIEPVIKIMIFAIHLINSLMPDNHYAEHVWEKIQQTTFRKKLISRKISLDRSCKLYH